MGWACEIPSGKKKFKNDKKKGGTHERYNGRDRQYIFFSIIIKDTDTNNN